MIGQEGHTCAACGTDDPANGWYDTPGNTLWLCDLCGRIGAYPLLHAGVVDPQASLIRLLLRAVNEILARQQ